MTRASWEKPRPPVQLPYCSRVQPLVWFLNLVLDYCKAQADLLDKSITVVYYHLLLGVVLGGS
jgi:hypothetical protein